MSSKTALSVADKLAVTVPAALTNNSPDALHFAVRVVLFPESCKAIFTLCVCVDSERFTVGAITVLVWSSTCKNPFASVTRCRSVPLPSTASFALMATAPILFVPAGIADAISTLPILLSPAGSDAIMSHCISLPEIALSISSTAVLIDPALLAISSSTALSVADKLAVTVPAALTNNSPDALHFAVLVVEFPESCKAIFTLCVCVESARFTVGAKIVLVWSSTCKNPFASVTRCRSVPLPSTASFAFKATMPILFVPAGRAATTSTCISFPEIALSISSTEVLMLPALLAISAAI